MRFRIFFIILRFIWRYFKYLCPPLVSMVVIDAFSERMWIFWSYLGFIGLSFLLYGIDFWALKQMKKVDDKVQNNFMSFYNADTLKTFKVQTSSVDLVILKDGRPAAKAIDPTTGSEILKLISKKDYDIIKGQKLVINE